MPFHPKKILVPTDFSPFAQAAADAALELAQRFEARLVLVHAVPLPVYSSYAAGMEGASISLVEIQEALHAAGEKDGAREVERLSGRGVPVELVVLDGPPPAEICAQAEALGADLIVIGSHGRTGLKRFLLGSVAENVVRHAPVPVLVVREK
jgi:nucleotide-binding universal stress UspA family protein